MRSESGYGQEFGTTYARGLALCSDGQSGYSVDEWGDLFAFESGSTTSCPVSSSQNYINSPWWPQPYAISRGVVVRSDDPSGYVLDGWGGVHPFGSAPAVLESSNGYWKGWDIARGIVLRSDGQSGYVLDGWGGLHPFGVSGDIPPTPTISAYWPGWDIAHAIVLRSDGLSGYVVDGWGGVHPFGGAPTVSTTAYWKDWDIARGIKLNHDGQSGYVLDGWGGLHPYGGAALPTSASQYWPGWDIARAIV